jgi:hypothetical protein
MPRSNAPSSRKPDLRDLGTDRWGRAFAGRVVLTLGLALLSACGGAEPDPEPRFSEPEYEGLTREEIERQAEAMTPEEAERLGIIDTTIRIEVPVGPDTLLQLPLDSLLRR